MANTDSLRASVQAQVDEILMRRRNSRERRAAVLESHPDPIHVRTELTRAVPPPGGAAPPPPVVAETSTAGYLLAIGDSWFDYPIHDVLTKLDDNYGYTICSSAHKGDSVEAMVSRIGQFDKFTRCVDDIVNHGATPKAILVSGGGDDIAGREFGMLINNIDLSDAGWNDEVLAGVIDERISTAYRRMFLTLNTLCTQHLGRTFPILVHGYDYPVPDGRGFLGGWGPLPGPWLKPGFDEKLFTDITRTTRMMQIIIDQFNNMLQRVAGEPDFANVHYVDVRGSLSNNLENEIYKQWWANELHPTGGGISLPGQHDGFGAVADRFQAVLRAL